MKKAPSCELGAKTNQITHPSGGMVPAQLEKSAGTIPRILLSVNGFALVLRPS